ncbi:MAG: HAMP domain-containing sensor histidine kinase [Oscillospiraceae bacterium]|nr:HAMP domain-containing sensor histidine kinase [Oscillospiraceae bacterium]
MKRNKDIHSIPNVNNGKGTFFLKYFLIFSSIILVSFLIIGIALMTFVATFLRSNTLDELSENSKSVSNMTSELVISQAAARNPEGAAMMLYKTLDIMSNCTDSDVFICNKYGTVIACKDILKNSFELSDDTSCIYHRDITIPASVIERVKDGEYSEFSKLDGVYSKTHAVALAPILLKGEFSGFVVVTSPVSGEIMGSASKILTMFLLAAAITLLVMTIALYFLTDKFTKPIRQLAAATRCYAAGDFSYKVPELNTNDELAELITEFNAMAVSLSKLENSRRSFVANVSHEFKTPMTTIGGFINGILDGTIPPEKQNYYLEIVASEVKRLSKMVNMMLNISKIETGNIDMNIEQFDVSGKLVSTFLGFEQLISDKKIAVMGLEDLSKTTVHGDNAMIDQVVYNLVDNAVKFTDENGKILVNTANDNKYAYFSITNSGKGIPKDDLKRVFDRFYKVDASRSTDVKSTGLGLYLVKSIVDLHGGTISVESEVNNFTRFTVKLPK